MADGDGGTSRGLSSQIEAAARALVDVLARDLAPTSSPPPLPSGSHSTGNGAAVRVGTSTVARQGVSPLVRAGASTSFQPPAGSDTRVRQALRRQFPSMFNAQSDQPRGKRRVSCPAITTVKTTSFHVYALSEPTKLTPKGCDELQLARAGLGKRLVMFPDNLNHNEIVALLQDEFPKLRTLQGGWMFYRASGGSGQRKLSVIPTDSEGYSTKLLKSASSNGKSTLFLVPLQECLSTTPLPFDSVEFAKMPQSKCIKCGTNMPLQLLPLHVEECQTTEDVCESTEMMPSDDDCAVMGDSCGSMDNVADSAITGESSEVCPICQTSYPTAFLPYHASSCGDCESAGPSRTQDSPSPSTAQLPTPTSAYTNEVDPQGAVHLFREELLNRNSENPSLSLAIDLFDAIDEQDSALICFYKQNNVNWAAPFKCRLRGDAAVGIGVNRHVLSMTMRKLKTGFSINFGSSAPTTIFEGERNHRVPSAAAVLRESNLFQMAGRMIGHSILHGGPHLSGLSLPIVILLTGGSPDTAAAALTLKDCPDLDHRETISLLRNEELTPAESTRVAELCLVWDLPVPSSSNREWLFQQLLTHAVLGRVKCQIKQIRKGLKDTGIWPLLSDRRDVHSVLFPRESVEDLDSQTILQNITWPKPKDGDDDEDEDDIPNETLDTITGFMRTFIEKASSEVLQNLMRFWVGWELPAENLLLEIVTAAKYPVALTCFQTLRLPFHYQKYDTFEQDMMMCLKSVNTGFGLV